MHGITTSRIIPTHTKGDDQEVAFVKYNNGTVKPMKHARKQCLSDGLRLAKQLGRPPTGAEWNQKRDLFTLSTVSELFGSFEEMLDQLKKRESDYAPRSKSTRTPASSNPEKKESKMNNVRWTDDGLVKALKKACDFHGKSDISIEQYRYWASTLGEENAPSHATITSRLGNGK